MATGTEVGSVYLRLALESDVNQQVQQATDEVGKTASTSFGNMFKKAFSVAAVAAAINALKNFSNEAINLYHIQEDAEIKLETVMKQRMNATDTQIQQIKDVASAIQNVGVIGDEVTLSGAQQLSTFLSSTEALETLLPAMDNLLAQQKGLNAAAGDAVNIGNLFGKVMQGQTSALSRVGITFNEAQEEILKYGTEEEKAATLAQVITDNVGEMNKALAATDSGQIKQLENNMSDVKEEFGEAFQELKVAFLPAMTEFVKLLADLATKFQAITGEITKFTQAVGWANSGEFADSLTGDAKSQYDDLIAQRNNILSQIQALTADDVEEVAEEVAEAVSESKNTDNSNPSASFDQFNILRFKDATKNLLDASETLQGAADTMGIDLSDTPDKDQIDDLQKLLQDIDKQIAELYNNNTYSPETVQAINDYAKERDENTNFIDKAQRYADQGTITNIVMNDEAVRFIMTEADESIREIFERYYDPETNRVNMEQMAADSPDTWNYFFDYMNKQYETEDDIKVSLLDVINGQASINDLFDQSNKGLEEMITDWSSYHNDTIHVSDNILEEIKETGGYLEKLVSQYMDENHNLRGYDSGMSSADWQYILHKYQNGIRSYASGGVAYQPELAIVGDHTSGGGEIMAPENLMRQIIKEELGRNNQTINLTAPIYIDGDYITDANIRNINTQTQLRGKQQIR